MLEGTGSPHSDERGLGFFRQLKKPKPLQESLPYNEWFAEYVWSIKYYLSDLQSHNRSIILNIYNI